MSITFSTCWYNFKAKFDDSVYMEWMDNMLSNVNNYNLVIYSDQTSSTAIEKYLKNPRIKLVIKPMEEFYNYKYKEFWIKNHANNRLLRERVDWRVNMLWAEKTSFVEETVKNQYFETEFYGWCDIGYFRGSPEDLNRYELKDWAKKDKIENLDKSRVYYACVNNNDTYLKALYSRIINKNAVGLPIHSIPEDQVSIAGGFFILYRDRAEWWKETFDDKLSLYFQYGYLVKDDQAIIADCIFSNLQNYKLCVENDPRYNNWFLFQRFLL